MTLIERIKDEFLRYGYKWTIKGKEVLPTNDVIGKVLDSVRESMYDTEDWNQVTIGNLIFQRNADHVDVYLRIGELEGDLNANKTTVHPHGEDSK